MCNHLTSGRLLFTLIAISCICMPFAQAGKPDKPGGGGGGNGGGGNNTVSYEIIQLESIE